VPAQLFRRLWRLDDAHEALTRSINTIAVKLSIAIGNGNPKAGRAKIVKNAKAMGLRTPLPDTPSLPIGADEVTVLDHTVAYATFPNLGKAVTPHAILEVRTGNGDVIWRFDRDGPKPRQVLPEKVALDMVFMMNKVVEEGTGKRAMLDGIKDRRQDRHHQQLSRRLVRRLYRQLWSPASGSATTTTARPIA
jgi:penicillin-binding protein 1A